MIDIQQDTLWIYNNGLIIACFGKPRPELEPGSILSAIRDNWTGMPSNPIMTDWWCDYPDGDPNDGWSSRIDREGFSERVTRQVMVATL